MGFDIPNAGAHNEALITHRELNRLNDTTWHHLLPFFGKCHVSYIPNGKIIGISKIPRIVDAFGRRLQVQERLTTQIANSLNDILKPKGVAVVVDALHLCMSMRGVEKQNSYTTTSSMLGAFKTNPSTRSEFLSLIAGRNR